MKRVVYSYLSSLAVPLGVGIEVFMSSSSLSICDPDGSVGYSSIFPQGVGKPMHKSTSNTNSNINNNSNNNNISNNNGSNIDCESFNSMWSRLQWAERRNRCCAQSGCVFLGRSITGTCTPADCTSSTCRRGTDPTPGRVVAEWGDASGPPRQEGEKNGLVKLYVEIASEKSTEPIKILLRDSMTASAVDSMRDSQELASELSKKILLNYLSNTENVVITSELADSLLSSPQIRAAIAAYIPYLATSPQYHRYALQYASSTKDYYLYPYGGGRMDCEGGLVNLLDWWFRTDATRRTVVVPLVTWALLLEGSVRIPAAELIAWALPAAQESTNDVFTILAVDYLKSEDTKKWAKDSIVALLDSIRPNSS